MLPERTESGRLPMYAWPGGYPLYYECEDGGILCPGCANRENGSEADTNDDAPRDWRIIDAGVHYEGAPLICDHCAGEIESADGDPDAT